MIETALTFLIYVVGILLLLGGIVFIANRIKPSEPLPLPEAPVWSKRTIKITDDMSDDEINKIVENLEQDTNSGPYSWTTVTKVSAKKPKSS